MDTPKRRKVIFKTPGDSITIGNQRFDASNITPEKADALIALDKANKEHFEFIETDHDRSLSEDEGAAERAAAEKKKTKLDAKAAPPAS